MNGDADRWRQLASGDGEIRIGKSYTEVKVELTDEDGEAVVTLGGVR